MIEGTVHPNGDAIVSLQLRGPTDMTKDIPSIVDTGFNDWLTLPAMIISDLGLSFREEGRYELADGTQAVTRLFTAEINWLGRWRKILVIEMTGSPLLGMGLLRGCHLGIDVLDGGQVSIRPL